MCIITHIYYVFNPYIYIYIRIRILYNAYNIIYIIIYIYHIHRFIRIHMDNISFEAMVLLTWMLDYKALPMHSLAMAPRNSWKINLEKR